MLSTIIDQEMYDVINVLRDELDKLDDELTKDSSGYVYVDGEEGDYGDILYYLETELIYTHRIHGGDMEEIILTDMGKKIVKLLIQSVLMNKLFN